MGEIATVISVFLIPFFPFTLGKYAAELAVKRKILSKVLCLTLKEPLKISGKRSVITARSTKLSSKKDWFFKANDSDTYVPKAFVYTFQSSNNPVYLVTTFKRLTLLYFPSQPDEKIINGKLVSISNDLIYAIEIRSSWINIDNQS